MQSQLKNDDWSDWMKFPDPRKNELLLAPFGCGVYQLYNSEKKKYVLFGSSKNTALRMTSLLPAPLGAGNRNNKEKMDYVFKNIKNIQYRTCAFTCVNEMRIFENKTKKAESYVFPEK